MKRIQWSAPAEVAPAGPSRHRPGCDCFWHRRLFTHVRLGPPVNGPDWASNCLPLGRTVTRTDHQDQYGRIEWSMEISMEGCLFEVRRLIHPPLFGEGKVEFQAIAGDPRRTGLPGGDAVRLEPHNDLSRRPGGGDPTLIWNLPARIGRARFPAGSQLVVWQEAWWWHLVKGTDLLAMAEQIDAVGHDDPPWPLLDSG